MQVHKFVVLFTSAQDADIASVQCGLPGAYRAQARQNGSSRFGDTRNVDRQTKILNIAFVDFSHHQTEDVHLESVGELGHQSCWMDRRYRICPWWTRSTCILHPAVQATQVALDHPGLGQQQNNVAGMLVRAQLSIATP